MTKAEIIQRYGEEWYANLKARNKSRSRQYYRDNTEKEKVRKNQYHADHPEVRKRAKDKLSEIYRIECRDRMRMQSLGLIPEGYEVHHLRYHKDNNDPDWIKDVLILSHDEHNQWHIDNPDFSSLDNVV